MSLPESEVKIHPWGKHIIYKTNIPGIHIARLLINSEMNKKRRATNYEIYIVEDGELEIYYQSVRRRFERDGICYIFPGEEYSIHAKSAKILNIEVEISESKLIPILISQRIPKRDVSIRYYPK